MAKIQNLKSTNLYAAQQFCQHLLDIKGSTVTAAEVRMYMYHYGAIYVHAYTYLTVELLCSRYPWEPNS